MANIIVSLDHEIIDGQSVTFPAPCDCNEITGLKVLTPDGFKVFVFKDAHGNELTGIGNLFSKGSYVKVVLDVNSRSAYIQNADTNAYLERKFRELATVRTAVVKLWENPDDTKAFGAQGVCADHPDLARCSGVFIRFRGTTKYDGHYVTGFLPMGELSTMFYSTKGGIHRHRSVSVRDTGILFGDGEQEETVSSSHCVPSEIYGIVSGEEGADDTPVVGITNITITEV